MSSEEYINRLLEYFDVDTYSELSNKIGIGQPAISKWRVNNSIIPIKKKCRELGIYNDIFGDIATEQTNNLQGSTNVVGQDFSTNSSASHAQTIGNKIDIDENTLKLLDTLYSFAKTNNKIEDLKKDLSSLLPKYM